MVNHIPIPAEDKVNLKRNKLAGLISVTKFEGRLFEKDGMRINL
jgi:hypothetical protein